MLHNNVSMTLYWPTHIVANKQHHGQFSLNIVTRGSHTVVRTHGSSWFLGLSNLKFQLQQSLEIPTSRVKGTHHYHTDVCSDVHYYQPYYQGGWVSWVMDPEWWQPWFVDPESLIDRGLFCSPRRENKIRCLFLGVFFKKNPIQLSLFPWTVPSSSAVKPVPQQVSLNHRIILVAGYL